MYGPEKAQILLDAFDRMWDNPILSADFVIDVWQQSLAAHKGNLKIGERAKDQNAVVHFKAYIKETEDTLNWLTRIHDERVDKYY